MNTKRIALQALAAAALAATGMGGAWAQADYPSKPIKLIVAFPPGGTSDVMGRLMAEELTKVLKQPVVVENIGGAGGVVGTDRAVKLPADGYTIIQTGVGQNAVAHGLDPNLKYNSVSDFIHLTQVHSGPNVLLVHPSLPFKSVKELVDFAKKNPGKLDYGYTHAASGHMAMELFKQTAGIFLTGIPYRGGGPMLNDLLAGTIPMVFLNQDVALPHVKAGKLRPLAVTSKERNALYPDVPTIAESGLPGYEVFAWNGVFVPAGTPKAIVAQLNEEIRKAMQLPQVRDKFSAQGFAASWNTPDQFGVFVRNEVDKWARTVKASGATLD